MEASLNSCEDNTEPMDEKLKRNHKISFEVNATWNISNNKVLNDAIFIEVDESLNLEDALSAETCVLLQRPNELEEHQLYISFRLPRGIASVGISVLSEARHVEVYNYNNEYITTIKSCLIDDNDDELKVYQSDAAFHRAMNEFKLKFLLGSKNEMWFYGAIIKISKAHLPLKGISFNNISTSRGNDAASLPDIKDITSFFQASSSNSPLNAIWQMLESTLRQQQEKSADSLKDNNECKCHSIKQMDSCSEPNNSTYQQNNHSNFSKPLDVIISDLEERLWTKLKIHLDAQEQRQTAILNRILALLEESKTSHE